MSNKKNGEYIACIECGSMVYKALRQLKRGASYCSKRCHMLHYHKLEKRKLGGSEVVCQYCKISFYRAPERIKNRPKPYCSRRCLRIHRYGNERRCFEKDCNSYCYGRFALCKNHYEGSELNKVWNKSSQQLKNFLKVKRMNVVPEDLKLCWFYLRVKEGELYELRYNK